jgi:predicted TIM-barrel fold metal-dependent hydrolase
VNRDEWVTDDGTATDVDVMRRHLFDDEGVTTAILCGFFHVSAMKANWEFACALASAYNDWQIAEWLDRDPRLLGSVHVVAHDPQRAVEEIERVARHPQIVQVFLPLVADRQYGDKQYRPIFEAAVRSDLVVAMHHGGATTTLFGYPNYFIEWHTLAAPLAGINQLMSLLASGIFDERPELKVVLLETGVGWLPWFMRRADENYKELRQDVPWVKRLPSDTIRAQVRIATQPMGEVSTREFLQIVETAEAEDVYVFSTDYPHYDADSADKTLPATVPQALRDKVRFGNALATYPRLAGLA